MPCCSMQAGGGIIWRVRLSVCAKAYRQGGMTHFANRSDLLLDFLGNLV